LTDPTTPHAPRKLSPPYPICDLQTAIEKVQRFFAALRKNAVDKDTAIPSLGYSANSRGKRVLGTVIAFGLLEEQPGGKTPQVKVSALGLRILRKEGDAAQQAADLQAAALGPTIYGEMVQQWPEELPNDAAIARYLETEQGFNTNSIASIIRDFRSTYAFAGLESREGMVKGMAAQPEETLPEAAAPPEAQQADEVPPVAAVEGLQSENAVEAPLVGKTTSTPSTEREEEKFIIPLLAGGRLVVRYPKGLQTSEVQMVDSAFAMIRASIGAE